MLLGLRTLCPGQVGFLELPQQASCIQYQQEGGREDNQVVSSSHLLVFLRILALRISPMPLILQAYGRCQPLSSVLGHAGFFKDYPHFLQMLSFLN